MGAILLRKECCVQDEIIFSGEDRYTKVEVIDRGNIRHLHFGTPIIQSSMYLDDPYALEMEYNQVMMLSLLWQPDPKNALFFGLGGGAKAKFLWRYFPSTISHAVEISPLVIATAQKYFALPQDERMVVECIAAEKYLEKPIREQFDLIFVDLYVGNQMAQALGDPSFFTSCNELLNPGGILVWNLWGSTPKTAVAASVQEVKSLFEEVLVLTVEESPNLVVICKEKTALSHDELERRAGALTAQTGLDFVKLLRNKLQQI
jgi:spermidine synthase